MAILWVIIYAAIGVVLGWLASLLFKGTRLLWDMIWGAVGSLGLPLICMLFAFGTGVTAFSVASLVMSIVGACVGILIYWFAKGRE